MRYFGGNLLQSFRTWIKQRPGLRKLALFLIRLAEPFGGLRDISALWRYPGFLVDWLRFKRLGGKAPWLEFYPCLYDRTASTGIDSHYFYQAIWGFKHIMRAHPSQHVDIGSDVRWVGMLTCITRVAFIDIRPLDLRLDGYEGKAGSILDLPYPDNSLESISSLHVIEHIGLGRYGDPLNPDGSDKAVAELKRVLAPGGRLYLSVPIGETRVQFNSQRVFSVTDVLDMCVGLRLQELSIVTTGGEFVERVDPRNIDLGKGHGLDYGLGLFIFSA